MEKEAVIEFLDKNWEEFILLLTGNDTSDTVAIPDYIHEFVTLLSDIITNRKKKPTLPLNNKDGSCSKHIPKEYSDMSAKEFDSKGLLGKAQIFRQHNEKSADSIIAENGLFVIKKQPRNDILDPAFKNLVDSVL